MFCIQINIPATIFKSIEKLEFRGEIVTNSTLNYFKQKVSVSVKLDL